MASVFQSYDRDDATIAGWIARARKGRKNYGRRFGDPLFRRDRRFMLAARKAGLIDYWLKSGKWPAFCFEEEPPYDCKTEAAKLVRVEN